MFVKILCHLLLYFFLLPGTEAQLASTDPQLDEDIHNLMTTYKIPGVQLAIIRNEEIVVSRSYGYADVEKGERLTEDSRFRIASISKPITAIGILKLVELGQLQLEDKVFGKGALLGNRYGTPPYAKEVRRITVQHLLENTLGWVNEPSDPMFSDVENTQNDIISGVLDQRSLATKPGEAFFYSNFGYSVLGRVIEAVTGKGYEEFIKGSILVPSGVEAMEIGGNTLTERLPQEVKYYSQEECGSYVMNVTRMDSHGGWIASATELAKFLTHIDRMPKQPDVLEMASLQQLYFGFEHWIINGSLPGTSTGIARYDDTYGYVILANTRTPQAGDILEAMHGVGERGIQGLKDSKIERGKD